MINLKIKTQNNEFNFQKRKGISLKEAIKSEDINFRFPCGGKGRCGNCKVTVKTGLEKPSRLDEMKIDNDEIKIGKRLGCCLLLNNDMEIELKETQIELLD